MLLTHRKVRKLRALNLLLLRYKIVSNFEKEHDAHEKLSRYIISLEKEAELGAFAKEMKNFPLVIATEIATEEVSQQSFLRCLPVPPSMMHTATYKKNGLNDEVINAFVVILNKKTTDSYMWSTRFYQKLYENDEYQYKRVRRWTKKIEIFSYHNILVPINVNENHWILVLIDTKTKALIYFDSFQTEKNKNDVQRTAQTVCNNLKRWLKDLHIHEKKSFPIAHWPCIIYKNTPQQDNFIDCGLFMVRIAQMIMLEKKIDVTPLEMPYFRVRLMQELHDNAESTKTRGKIEENILS